MSTRAILARLRRGPATNAELQDACCDHSAGVARTMAKLIADGRAVRVDGRSGRGRPATYALPEDRHG